MSIFVHKIKRENGVDATVEEQEHKAKKISVAKLFFRFVVI